MSQRIVSAPQNSERLEDDVVNEINDQSAASAGHCVNQRLGQAAFTLHGGERTCWICQNQFQSLDKSVEKSPRLSFIPRQAAARRGSGGWHGCDGRRYTGGHASRLSRGGELGHLRKRQPRCHSLAPAQISPDETPRA